VGPETQRHPGWRPQPFGARPARWSPGGGAACDLHASAALAANAPALVHTAASFRMRPTMATVPLPADPEADPRVKAVFDDIRATRKTDFINNLWRALAFDPPLLERTWADVKALMATPTLLDPLTKEMVYIAVSIANACSYCVHSHTAAARAKGMSDAMHAELLAIVSLAARTNHLANALQVPVDAAFDAAAR
jgi:AhpD family alkylhydroperoxidase